jgi:predicted protein tyrosine phosphatase
MALAFAFSTKTPRVFQKRWDGRLPLFSWVMFGPYLAYMHLLLWAWRFLSREPAFAEVAPGLYLGRRLGWGEQKLVAPIEPLAVLDLTAEFAEPEFMREQGEYLSLPVLDTTAPTPQQFDKALAFIRDHARQRPVYVHCALGHGRSAAVVAAYLLAEKKFASLEEVCAFLRSQRFGVRLNRRQKKAVRHYLELHL